MESPPEELPEDAAGTTLFLQSLPNEVRVRSAPRFPVRLHRGAFAGDGRQWRVFRTAIRCNSNPGFGFNAKIFFGAAAFSLSRNAPEVTMVAPDEWSSIGHRSSPFMTGMASREVWYRFGKGEVIWWRLPRLFRWINT